MHSVAESIPSSLVQLYAVFVSGEKSTANIASIITSIATISFCSASICFDFDLDPDRRIQSPDFYGFVPNNGGRRNAVLVLMFSFTACHVAVRMLGVALLAVVDPMLVIGVLGGDQFVFFVFKILRDDLRYWLKLDGVLSWFASFLIRLVSKEMVDFTAIVQLRHPQEIGRFVTKTRGCVQVECKSLLTPQIFSVL